MRARSERDWWETKRRWDAKLRKEEVAALGPRRFGLGDALFSGLAGGAGVAIADRIDNQGRRYSVILLALRAAHPTWESETVRNEARRLLKAETWRAAGGSVMQGTPAA